MITIKLNMKMKLYLKKSGPIALITLSFILASACKNNQTTTELSPEDHLESFRQNIARVMPDIGSPGDIAILIELTGAEYVPELVTDTSNVDMYIGDSDWAALNLGLYTANLAYTAAFNQKEQSLGTLRACQTLANDLEIGETYLTSILNYYSDEVAEDRKDTLTQMLSDEAGKIMENFNATDRKRLYTAFVTGFVIENLHLATGIIDSYPDDLLPDDVKALILREMLLVVIKGGDNLDELLVLLSEVLTKEDTKILYNELVALQASFKKIDMNNLASVNEPGAILKSPLLQEITEQVKLIRGSIIR